VTGKGKHLQGLPMLFYLGKYRLGTAQEETVCSASAQRRLSIPPRRSSIKACQWAYAVAIQPT
jgi:hypothetical protein